jgi:tryptophan 2,3-dioxygenase
MPLNICIGKQQARIIQQEKSYLLQEFERKYKDLFCVKWNNTIPSIFGKNSNNYQIKIKIIRVKKCYASSRSYYKYYLMQHLNVAIKYIDHSGLGDGEATEVVTYMHPSTNVEYFPELWTEEEIAIGEIKLSKIR